MADSLYKTKKDIVVEVVRKAILSGELEPGERLTQNELAERLNVSPTPVREALRQLEAEGILDHSPHKGVRVAEVNLEDVREIYLIRSVLEPLATREAIPNFDHTDIQRIRTLQNQIDTCLEKEKLKKLRKPNYQLHMLIYEAAGMPELYRIIQNLWTKFPWDTLHVLPGRASVSGEEHRQIIEAIEAGDAKLAAQRMQEHIVHGATALTEYLIGNEGSDIADMP